MQTLFNYLPLLNALFCLGIGLYVLSRNWKLAANIGFFVGMAALGGMEFAAYMGASTVHGVYASSYNKLFGAGEILLPASWFVFSLSFARAEVSRSFERWRPVSIPLFALTALLLFLSVADSSFAERVTSKGVGFWVSVFLVLSLTITLANLEATLRSADPARRGKIKFLLLGIGSILLFQLYVHSQYLLFPRLEQDFSAVQSSILFIACLLVTFSLVRHQLMDVDVFVSRDFVYHSFTVGAVGVYLLVVGLAGQAIKSVGGIPTLYLKSLFVFLTVLFLVAVLLSHSVQKRVKIFIERNFYRHRYDYHQEWLALTDKLSSKLEVKDLIPVIANMFLQTLWIENTRLWLYDDREKEFQAVEASQGDRGAPIRWEPGLLDALRERDYPIPIDELKDLAGGTGIGPGQMKAFREMGIAILSPLIIKSHFVGILGLSGTMSKYPLDQEDYDLVRTVSKQVAGSFLNARLSRELLQAKEMETFHAFSAFVIHDLKNFVSMLSLVVHNAKGNFEDPEFRADALQSISQTADKMKRMMDRLAVLSRPMEVERTRTDLNDVARGALSELNGALGSKVAAEFGMIMALAIDPVQMKKVVTNLLLNAAEASGEDGGIRLSTAQADGWVVLTVSDDGCGMTQEFIEGRLFKPFSTTKSGGFGIGLYQVKGIVEAHGGKIEVQSAVGRGSSFRVLLPKGAAEPQNRDVH
jgi:putative PEP-CTERM system histidine kinase